MSRTGTPFHHSELAKLRRCEMQHHYAYVREGVGLRKKREALQLKRGLWLHALLQADALKRGLEHGSLLEVPETIDVPGIEEPVVLTVDTESGEAWLLHDDEDGVYPCSWKGMLDLLAQQSDYAMLPDSVIEEHYIEGGQDLPTACRNIMRGYLWQWRRELPKRKPLLVEVEWQRTDNSNETPVTYEGRADLVEINERGIVCVTDWKSTKSLPGQEYRLLESQRFLYAWGLQPLLAEHDLKIQALALDYLVTSTPTKPTQNLPVKPKTRKAKCPDCEGTGQLVPEQDHGDCPQCEGSGKRVPDQPTPNELKGELSKREIRTTPIVYFEALKEYGLEITDRHREKINRLEQEQDFYKRLPMPLNQKVLVTKLRENAQAAVKAKQLRELPQLAIRSDDRSCVYACDFLPLCTAELYGMDASTIREQGYELRKPDEEGEDE